MSNRKCIIALAEDDRYRVSHFDVKLKHFTPCVAIPRAELTNYVIKNHLVAVTTCCVVQSGQYQMFIADKPDVALKEMAESLLWQEQERFDVEVNHLALEYQSSELNTQQQLLVTCIKKSYLQSCYQQIDDAGLRVKEIIVPESCYPSYLAKEHKGEDLVVVLRLYDGLSQALVFFKQSLASELRLPSAKQKDYFQLIQPVLTHLKQQIADGVNVAWLIEANESVANEVRRCIEGECDSADLIKLDFGTLHDPASASVALEVAYGA